MRILVAEGDPQMARLLSRALRGSGHAVDLVATGESAVDYATQGTYDLIVLNARLPAIDGFAACRRIRRAHRRVPILMLSARSDVTDRVRGLGLGADDYLTKPIAIEELLARVRALLRRREIPQQVTLTVGSVRLDRSRHRAHVGQQTIDLTAREFAVLEYLLLNRGRVVTRSQIAEHVWDDGFDPTSNLVDVYVGRVRRKVDKYSDRGHSFLTTLRGVGYCVVDDSRSTDETARTRNREVTSLAWRPRARWRSSE